ncbi:MAG: hypothetical protein LC117_10495 [Bacteroidia bacterium]|nr:hypothetical protein [Bacteroidia bacterium]MCZ2278344.1 hypothetical protein [Bacteroidia bacterium]
MKQREAINSGAIYEFRCNGNTTRELVHYRQQESISETAPGKISYNYRIPFSKHEMNVNEKASLLNIRESHVTARPGRVKSILRNETGQSFSYKELFGFDLIHCDAMVERVMKQIEKLA